MGCEVFEVYDVVAVEKGGCFGVDALASAEDGGSEVAELKEGGLGMEGEFLVGVGRWCEEGVAKAWEERAGVCIGFDCSGVCVGLRSTVLADTELEGEGQS